MERRARELMKTLPPTLLTAFKTKFPDVVNAINDSAPNLAGVLKTRMASIVQYFGTQADKDVNTLLDALKSPDTAAEIIQIGKEIITPANTSTVKPAITFQAGAFQVVIQGNADAVTVEDLKLVLEGWGQQI